MILISATNRNKKRRKSDFYITPIATIHNFLKHHKIKNGNILDPGAGNGSFAKAIKQLGYNNYITSVEVRKDEYDNLKQYSNEVVVEDFLKWKPSKNYKTIIGNPPYSLAQEFLEKCFKIADNNTEIIMLLRLAFLESKKGTSFGKSIL